MLHLPLLPTLKILLTLLLPLLLLLTLRILLVLRTSRLPPPPRPRPAKTRLLIVLGSGGHTHEMLRLLREVDPGKWTERIWVVGRGDGLSVGRVEGFERGLVERWGFGGARDEDEPGDESGRAKAKNGDTSHEIFKKTKSPTNTGPFHYTIHTLPRARHIHQPLLTTPLTALHTLLSSFYPLLHPTPPDLILTNGPATGAIIALAAFVLRVFNVKGVESRGKCRVIFVESFARVKGLSLTGLLVGRWVDRCLVQWEGLAEKGKGEYWGVLV